MIAFDGGWLALVHEAGLRDKQRHYRHRFVWFDEATRLRGVSRPFFFDKSGVEFAAGLAWHPDGKRLVVSYGVEDSEAWIATVDADDVRCVLEDVEQLPSGRLPDIHSTESRKNWGRGAIAGAMMPSREIREICGDHASLSAGPGESPFGLVKRPDSVEARRASVNDEQRRVIEPDAATSVTLGDCTGQQNKTDPSTPSDALRVETTAPINREATAEEKFLALAPFLRAVDSPKDRREQSRAFDARIAPFMSDGDTAALPQIHCFYEVMSETAQHASLIAATQSMRAAGHPVRVWSYSPEKLDFLTAARGRAAGRRGRRAAEPVRAHRCPLGDPLFQRHLPLRRALRAWRVVDGHRRRDAAPVPIPRRPLLQPAMARRRIKGTSSAATSCMPSPTAATCARFTSRRSSAFSPSAAPQFGDVGPKLLSDYITSDAGRGAPGAAVQPDVLQLHRLDRGRPVQPAGRRARGLSQRRAGLRHPFVERAHPFAARDDDRR